jgi:hypothetical protein
MLTLVLRKGEDAFRFFGLRGARVCSEAMA